MYWMIQIIYLGYEIMWEKHISSMKKILYSVFSMLAILNNCSNFKAVIHEKYTAKKVHIIRKMYQRSQYEMIS